MSNNEDQTEKKKQAEARVKFCKCWDCGWCYSKDPRANDTNGACNNANTCEVLADALSL
jgi:hypothetical protein